MIHPRAFLFSLAAAAASGGTANAAPLGACIWSSRPKAEQTQVLSAYGQSMAAGAAALDKLAPKLRTAADKCAGRRDIPADWVPTVVGAEAVQAYVASVLKTPRPTLDAAWAAAPAKVAACVRANGRLAFYPNGLGCSDPAAPTWLLKQAGIDPSQQPAARLAAYYFNARAIGEWGDQLVAKLPPKGR